MPSGATDILDLGSIWITEDNAGAGSAVSLEVGHKVVLDDVWAVTGLR